MKIGTTVKIRGVKGTYTIIDLMPQIPGGVELYPAPVINKAHMRFWNVSALYRVKKRTTK